MHVLLLLPFPVGQEGNAHMAVGRGHRDREEYCQFVLLSPPSATTSCCCLFPLSAPRPIVPFWHQSYCSVWNMPLPAWAPAWPRMCCVKWWASSEQECVFSSVTQHGDCSRCRSQHVLLLGVQCPAVRVYIQCFFKRVSHHLPAAGKQLGESWRVCIRTLLRWDTDFQESMIFHNQCSMKVTVGDFFFTTPTRPLVQLGKLRLGEKDQALGLCHYLRH